MLQAIATNAWIALIKCTWEGKSFFHIFLSWKAHFILNWRTQRLLLNEQIRETSHALLVNQSQFLFNHRIYLILIAHHFIFNTIRNTKYYFSRSLCSWFKICLINKCYSLKKEICIYRGRNVLPTLLKTFFENHST